MNKVFIDGSAGTTGLRIRERLEKRGDITLLTLTGEARKDLNARLEAVAEADISLLCLPDEAARELAALAPAEARLIDTSTAHRTAPGWVYGFPELVGAETVASATRIANPGCHASGFIALVTPLLRAGLLPKEALVSCFSVTGYTGGGNKMIAQYEDPGRDAALDSPRQYGLGQSHKHLPEMQRIPGLAAAPLFSPVVADFPCGMAVTVPLFAAQLRGSAADVADCLRAFYPGPVVRFTPWGDPMLPANALAGKDSMLLSVHGNDERLLLTALFDNLGKGASGAAIQNMNLALGLEETLGLVL